MSREDDGRYDVIIRLAPLVALARVARTVAASYASVHGLSIDELDDVRLLVDEVFHLLSRVGGTPVTISLGVDDALRIEMEVACTHAAQLVASQDDVALVQRMAAVIAIDHTVEIGPERAIFVARIGRTLLS